MACDLPESVTSRHRTTHVRGEVEDDGTGTRQAAGGKGRGRRGRRPLGRRAARGAASVWARRLGRARPAGDRPQAAARELHGGDGAVGVGEVDVPPVRGGVGPAHGRVRTARRDRDHGHEREQADRTAARPAGVRVPGVQPAAVADGGAERTAADAPCGAAAGAAPGRGAPGAGGARGKGKRRPGELSGGQQQRVAIARALVTRPDVVFADEPTGALDTRTAAEVLSLLRNAVDGMGATVVMVTHDPSAAAYADQVLFLADGSMADALTGASAGQIAARMTSLTAPAATYAAAAA